MGRMHPGTGMDTASGGDGDGYSLGAEHDGIRGRVGMGVTAPDGIRVNEGFREF